MLMKFFYDKWDQENQELIAEIFDIIQPNENSQIREKTNDRYRE